MMPLATNMTRIGRLGILIGGVAIASPQSHTANAEGLSIALNQRIESVTNFTPRSGAINKPVMSVQQMVGALRDGGMPISAIAESMCVGRKTIYSWLNGVEVRGHHAQRVAQIHDLLTSVPNVDARNIYRFWNTRVDGTRTLRELLTGETLDQEAVKAALGGLRESALRAMASEQRMASQGSGNPVLDEIPEAGTSL